MFATENIREFHVLIRKDSDSGSSNRHSITTGFWGVFFANKLLFTCVHVITHRNKFELSSLALDIFFQNIYV